MKKILLLIMFTLNVNIMLSQEGVEIPLNYDTNINIQSGTYIKDIDNVFLPYIGTWEGTWYNKRFILKIEKNIKEITTQPSGYYYYEDRLCLRYKIINLNDNSIIENNLDIDLNNSKIKSLAYPTDNRFDFFYLDIDLCSISGTIVLLGDPTTNQLSYKYLFENSYWQDDCPYAQATDIPIPIPIVSVTLTRL